MKKCGECGFWIRKENMVGECHRYPPMSPSSTSEEVETVFWNWLEINEDEMGCGEFRPREGAREETEITDQVNWKPTTNDTELLKKAIMQTPVQGRIVLRLTRLNLEWPLWRVANAMGVSRPTLHKIEWDQYTQPSKLEKIRWRIGDEAFAKIFGGGKG